MNSKRIVYGYSSIGILLVAGCLFARNGRDVAHRPPHAGGENSSLTIRPASYLLPDPLPEDTTDRGSLPAEKVYKNIQTLRGISARELLGTMTFMSGALGVRCGFCHAHDDFSSDEKPEKKTARSMILMTHDINAKNFATGTVTCVTCHRGSPAPVAAPSLSQGAWQPFDVVGPYRIKHDSTMTVDAVLDRYMKALGGEAALAKITTRVARANEVQGAGGTATVDIFQKSPNLLRSITASSDPKRGTGVQVYDGRAGWMLSGNRPATNPNNAELENLMRQAELFPATDLRKSHTQVRLLGKEHITDRDFYVLSATRGAGTDRLYFDAASGLLARRYVEFGTPLGPIPFSIEYSDYRPVDGVMVPFTVKTSSLRDSWTDTITQIRQNAAVADTMFAKPR
ncbi:MAG: c-type cytochrome [Bacteroidota bacterium]